MEQEVSFRQHRRHDVASMRELLAVFGEAFDERDRYKAQQPSEAYLGDLLGSDTFIALVAQSDDRVIGGLIAYELKKPERALSELYIYDLAVLNGFRRRSVATGLINQLKPIARTRGARVIFVQADYVDPPAIALYTKLGLREDVLHFDISVS
jgi:aminoglycoside 3-N-acetyltransferase I